MDRAGELHRQLVALNLKVENPCQERLLWLLEELQRWNRRINLTAVGGGAEGIEKHLIDSLTLLPLLGGDERLLDLGSGGGFPGLPLKIALSKLRVTSVDAVGKKIAFQRHVVRTLALEGFEALQARAEDLPRREGVAAGFEVVVSRAFASLPDFARLALPCLSPGGRLLAMKGGAGMEELKACAGELDGLGLQCTDMRRLRLPASGAERTLLILQRGADFEH